MRWRAAIAILISVLVLAGGAAYVFRGPRAVAAMGKTYGLAMGTNHYAGLGDGLHIGPCGSGLPLPDPTRAGPCVACLRAKDCL